MQVKKGDSVAVSEGRDATEGTLHLEVVEGFAAFEGVSRWNHRHSTYLRPTRGSTVVFGSLASLSSALALVVTRATAPLGIQRLFRVISKLPTLPRRGAFSTAA